MSKGICFVIMPITTPSNKIDIYNGDSNHFTHVYEHLFAPAIEKAGFTPLPPIAEGADNIQASIIENLEKNDLVLCDMSLHNANVFFELGIRTALDKPVCLVKDEFTSNIPFDTSTINFHTYNPDLSSWIVKKEIDNLHNHVIKSFERSDNRNPLWRYFGLTNIGKFGEGKYTSDDKLEYLISEVQMLKDAKILERSLPSETLHAGVLNKTLKIIRDQSPNTAGLLSPLAASISSKDGKIIVSFTSSVIAEKFLEDKHFNIFQNALEIVLGRSYDIEVRINKRIFPNSITLQE